MVNSSSAGSLPASMRERTIVALMLAVFETLIVTSSSVT